MVDSRTNWQRRVSNNNTVSQPVNVNSYVLTKIKIYCSVLLNGCVMCPYFAHQKFHQSTSLFIVSFGIHVHINQYAVSLVLAVADFGMSLGLLLAQKKTRPPEKSLAHNGFGHVLCFIHYEHTHTFNGPLSGTTRVSRYQKGKTNLDFTEARDCEWQWHQLDHMQVCTLLQTDNHTSTPPLTKFFTGRMPFLPPNEQRQSTKGRRLHITA